MAKPKISRNLALIYGISFMDLFAVGLTFPLFSNHLKDLGASHFTIGLISSLYSGLQVISGPIIGGWSDVRDRRSVLIITQLICSMAYILLGTTNSITVIVMLRFVLGISKHTQSLSKAIITDLLPANQRAGAFGRSSAFGSIGFIAGPVLGGHLSESVHGFFYVCCLTGILFLTNICLVMLIDCAPKSHSHKHKTFYGEFHSSVVEMTAIDWSALWDTFLLRFLFGLSMTMYFSQQSLYLQEQFHLSQRQIGYTISFFSSVGTASAFLVDHINRKLYGNDDNCLRRMRDFFVLMTLCSFCLFMSSSIQLFLVFLAPFAISCTVLRIVSMELMLKKAKNNHRGSLSGTSNSIMSVGRFVTPVFTGFVSDRFGGETAMLTSVVPPFLGVVVVLAMGRNGAKTKVKAN